MPTRPPGPEPHFLIGNMPLASRDPLAVLTRWARQYGDIFYYRAAWIHVYFLNHPDLIESVLVRNHPNLLKDRVIQNSRWFFGDGLLTSEGEEWKRQRRLTQPAFHRDRVASYANSMVEYTQRLISAWQEGETRDIHRDMMRLTLEIVVRCLFSADVSNDVDEVGTTLKELVKPFASQATLKWILNNRLPTPYHFRFHALAEKIDKVIYRIIAERRATAKDEGDLLSMLLAAHDEDGSQMSDRQLRDEAITLFLPGHETTALTLAWASYLIGKHHEAEEKFHAELDEVLGDREPEVTDLPRLRYTEQIAKESLRLYPPAYGLGREAIDDCEIGGYHVPKGTQVFMFQWATQRDPRFYDEPLEFQPERWTDEFIGRLPKYAYFPFGRGPRACIGASFAMMEIILVLATIGQKFRLELVHDPPVSILPSMSLRPKEGIQVRIERR